MKHNEYLKAKKKAAKHLVENNFAANMEIANEIMRSWTINHLTWYVNNDNS